MQHGSQILSAATLYLLARHFCRVISSLANLSQYFNLSRLLCNLSFALHCIPMMSRPHSMPDFAALIDTCAPLLEKRIHNRRQTSPDRRHLQLRNKPSVSLATGLIMNSDSQRSLPPGSSPLKPRNREEPGLVESKEDNDGGSLFYAYALRCDLPSLPPCILTFASRNICSRWWTLVERECAESARLSPQLFVICGAHLDTMRSDSKFYEIRNMWFYTSQDGVGFPPAVIPSQAANSCLAPGPQRSSSENSATFALVDLAEKLERLTGIVEKNAEQIHALSVAQSAGLEHMQEINEANSSQIKAIGDAQLKLQSLVDQNASHYIALSNTSFQSHEQTKKSQDQTRKAQEETRDILNTTISKLITLSNNQEKLSQTCENMMRSVEKLSNSVSHVNMTAISDMASLQSANATFPSPALSKRMSPGPRKLNRRIKGVWYEYDEPCSTSGILNKSGKALDKP